MSKLRKFLNWFIDTVDDVLAYFCTIGGILFSNAIPLLKTNEPFVLDMGVWRIVAAAFVAFMMVRSDEKLKPDEKGDTKAARDGRRSHFWERMKTATAQGFMWAQITNIGA